MIALYLRISSDPYNLRAGVDRQMADCRQIAESRGWSPVEVYEDNDRSAWSGKRPAWEMMLADITAGRVTGVIAWDMDRLIRQPRDLERFLDVCAAARLTSVITAQGDIDLTSHDGQLHARILAAVAKKESDDKSRRVRRAKLDMSENGRWQGGRPPFGYRAVGDRLEVVEEDAAVVREAAAWVLGGGSLRKLAQRGVGPKSQQGWRVTLLSKTIMGIGSGGRPGNWEPIIDEQTGADLRALLSDPNRLTHRGSQLAHWLQGLLVCGPCERAMKRSTINGKARYNCAHCMRVSISATPVEEFVEGAIIEAAPTVGAPPAPELIPPKGDGVPLGGPDVLTDLAQMYARGEITRAEWVAAREVAVRPVAPIITPATPVITDELWATWGPVERRRAARWLLARVVVHPAAAAPRGHLTDRIEFDWVR